MFQSSDAACTRSSGRAFQSLMVRGTGACIMVFEGKIYIYNTLSSEAGSCFSTVHNLPGAVYNSGL